MSNSKFVFLLSIALVIGAVSVIILIRNIDHYAYSAFYFNDQGHLTVYKLKEAVKVPKGMEKVPAPYFKRLLNFSNETYIYTEKPIDELFAQLLSYKNSPGNLIIILEDVNPVIGVFNSLHYEWYIYLPPNNLEPPSKS